MSRLLPRFQRELEDEAWARKLARILLESGAALPASSASARAPGDPHKLRGLPVVGVRGGLGGAIAGTRPGTSRALEEWAGTAQMGPIGPSS